WATVSRVDWRTSARPFITLEAVARDTPAFSATSFSVTRSLRALLWAMTSPLPAPKPRHPGSSPWTVPGERGLTGHIIDPSLNRNATFSLFSCLFRALAQEHSPRRSRGGSPYGAVRHVPRDAAGVPARGRRAR